MTSRCSIPLLTGLAAAVAALFLSACESVPVAEKTREKQVAWRVLDTGFKVPDVSAANQDVWREINRLGQANAQRIRDEKGALRREDFTHFYLAPVFNHSPYALNEEAFHHTQLIQLRPRSDRKWALVSDSSPEKERERATVQIVGLITVAEAETAARAESESEGPLFHYTWQLRSTDGSERVLASGYTLLHPLDPAALVLKEETSAEAEG